MVTIVLGLEDYDELEKVKELCIVHDVIIKWEKDMGNHIWLEIGGHHLKALIIQDYIEAVNRKKYFRNTWIGKIYSFIFRF